MSASWPPLACPVCGQLIASPLQARRIIFGHSPLGGTLWFPRYFHLTCEPMEPEANNWDNIRSFEVLFRSGWRKLLPSGMVKSTLHFIGPDQNAIAQWTRSRGEARTRASDDMARPVRDASLLLGAAGVVIALPLFSIFALKFWGGPLFPVVALLSAIPILIGFLYWWSLRDFEMHIRQFAKDES